VRSTSVPNGNLWIKRDDLTHDVYGGNKVRKLEYLLAAARAREAKTVVTVGAVGSHHVLATSYFGAKAGLRVEAVLVPQPATDHALEVLRADLGLGCVTFPVTSWGAVPLAVARRVAAGAWLIPVGGSNVVGSMGYVQAARELSGQVRAGELPEPDVCVVALGSGGTAAGLAAGLEAEGLRTRVIGVCVSSPPWLLRLVSLRLASALRNVCARCAPSHAGPPRTARSPLRSRLEMDARFLGPGYGVATPEGDGATRIAREEAGLTLDPTYTAKAFASALWHAAGASPASARHVLYWHTLSSAPMEPLLLSAPDEGALDPRLRDLLTSRNAH
jgi:D-cysteine desulfhydrase